MLRHGLVIFAVFASVITFTSCLHVSDEVSITVDRLSVCGFDYTEVTVDQVGRIKAIASGYGAQCIQPVVPEGSAANWAKALNAIKQAADSAGHISTIEIDGVTITRTSKGFVVTVG